MVFERFRGYTGVEADALPEVASPESGTLIHVRPHKENEGIDAGIEFLRALHTLKTGVLGVRNASDTHSFELWYRGGQIQFVLYAATEEAATKFRKQITAHYPDAELQEYDRWFLPYSESDYVAGARIGLKKHFFFPIKNPEGVEPFDADPYRALTSEMIGDQTSRMLIQVVFRPAKSDWTAGGLLGDDVVEVGEGLKQGKVVGELRPRVVDASQKRRQAGETVQAQKGKQAFHVNVRVLSVAPSKDAAEVRARGVGAIFTQYYNAVTEQGLDDTPVHGRKLRKLVERTARREWTDREMVLTVPELAGVAHIPDESIETPDVDWNRTQRGAHLPADAEQPQDNVR